MSDNRRKIKVKYVDWWLGFDYSTYLIHKILSKHYDIEISDTPDYVFCSVYSKDFMQYDCIRILYSAENFSPDFNLVDYAIGFDYLDFGDRYVRIPNYIMNPKYEDSLNRMRRKHLSADEDIRSKSKFCSFVVSNGVASEERDIFFDELSEYKKVDSGGRYRNNIGAPKGVTDKYEFQKDYKFAIAFENSCQRGYCTEKLVDAFAARTVPIYWGDPLVQNVFNEKAMIIVKNKDDYERAIELVKNLDAHDDLYKQYISQPALVDPQHVEKCVRNLEQFLCNIVDMPLAEARRRTTIPLTNSYYASFYCEAGNKGIKEKIKSVYKKFFIDMFN